MTNRLVGNDMASRAEYEDGAWRLDMNDMKASPGDVLRCIEKAWNRADSGHERATALMRTKSYLVLKVLLKPMRCQQSF